jgi:hypothetical protein
MTSIYQEPIRRRNKNYIPRDTMMTRYPRVQQVQQVQQELIHNYFEDSTNKDHKYLIDSHGTMPFFINKDKKKAYYSITIPKNVEIYVFTEIGDYLTCNLSSTDFICGFTKKKQDTDDYEKINIMNKNVYKYKYEPGKENKFPNLFLTKDRLRSNNSGIIYCKNPDQKDRVIYNLDADPYKNCECDSIIPKQDKIYDCVKNYSDFYKELLEQNKKNCGDIFLSDALKIIQDHSESLPSLEKNTNQKIKIFIAACLNPMDIERFIDENYVRQTILNNKENRNNYVYRLDDFKSTKIDVLDFKNKFAFIIILQGINFIVNLNSQQMINKLFYLKNIKKIIQQFLAEKNYIEKNIPTNVIINIESEESEQYKDDDADNYNDLKSLIESQIQRHIIIKTIKLNTTQKNNDDTSSHYVKTADDLITMLATQKKMLETMLKLKESQKLEQIKASGRRIRDDYKKQKAKSKKQKAKSKKQKAKSKKQKAKSKKQKAKSKKV